MQIQCLNTIIIRAEYFFYKLFKLKHSVNSYMLNPIFAILKKYIYYEAVANGRYENAVSKN